MSVEIQVDEDLYSALEFEARRKGVSKASLIRRYIARAMTPPEGGPLFRLAGAFSFEPADVDTTLYR